MMQLGRVDLLSHPVVNTYIKLKWNKYGFWMYLFFFALRLLLAILVSVFTVLIINPNRQSSSVSENSSDLSEPNATLEAAEGLSGVSIVVQTIRTAALVINLVLSVHILLPIVSLGFHILNFVANTSLWIFAFALTSNFVFLLAPNPLAISPAGAMACFFSWLMVLIALGFFDVFGIYIRMFLQITHSVFQVLVPSLILILAFSFAFYVLIDSLPNFSMFQYSLVTVFFYMLGDFQQDSLVSQEIEGKLRNGELVFLFLFAIVILLSIVMANLLIGLAVGDIEKIKKNASLQKKELLVNYFGLIDRIPIFRRYAPASHTRYPNAKVSPFRQVWRYMWRAAKENATSEGESSDCRTMPAEDKLECIMDHLDKLTAKHGSK